MRSALMTPSGRASARLGFRRDDERQYTHTPQGTA
jgi:hypothetical protein